MQVCPEKFTGFALMDLSAIVFFFFFFFVCVLLCVSNGDCEGSACGEGGNNKKEEAKAERACIESACHSVGKRIADIYVRIFESVK